MDEVLEKEQEKIELKLKKPTKLIAKKFQKWKQKIIIFNK